MRVFSLFLAAAICSILGPASVGPSQAQTAEWFSFEVCNSSSVRNVSIAILSKNDLNGSSWHLAGWYIIPDGGCTTIGGYWRDRVYFYGQGDDGAYWTGNDTPQCVNLTARFERTVTQGYECSRGETSVGMSLVLIPANVGTYQLNLQ